MGATIAPPFDVFSGLTHFLSPFRVVDITPSSEFLAVKRDGDLADIVIGNTRVGHGGSFQ